jgi:glycosyltransferase involved in cell wall biosynthesis
MNRSVISMFLPTLGGGGAERMIVNLAGGLAGRGVEVDLVVANAVGPFRRELDRRVNVVDLRARGALASLPRLSVYLGRTRPKVLLVTLSRAANVAIVARKLARSPTQIFIREANTLSQFAAQNWKERLILAGASFLYPFADGVIAVSEGVAKDIAASFRISDDKIHVVYNPVVTPNLASLAAEEPGHAWLQEGQPPVVLGVGRLHPQKGFDNLIHAVALANQTRPTRLLILGEGDERFRLEACIAKYNLEGSVRLEGFVPNPFMYMARADLFALSSRWEGLPSVLIQALACGCPVVSTDCPSGPREILQGGKFGELVPVDKPELLAESILKGLGRRRPREVLTTATERFSLETSCEAYERILFGHSSEPS